MATSLLALIDDIASILDDVAVAAKKTSSLVSDDLALSAQQLGGITPDRELPVIWAVAKGSLINKVILVPLAIAISAWAPFLIAPLLMIGGLFLCFEGIEKLHEKMHKKDTTNEVPKVISESEKIKGAVTTDFILSAEIIVIALGTLNTLPIFNQALSLSIIALFMTVFVYGLVAFIIKIDDAGIYLIKKQLSLLKMMGKFLINTAPLLMKVLGVLGTAAMFLVGGGIIMHGIPFIGDALDKVIKTLNNSTVEVIGALSAELTMGVVCGVIVFLIVKGIKKIKKK